MNSTRVTTYVVIAALALIIWFAHGTLLFVFAGMLLSLVLRRAAERVAQRLRIKIVVAVWLTAIAGLLLVAGGVALLGNAVASQVSTLRETLPAALADIVQQMRTTPAGVWIAHNLPSAAVILPDAHILTRAGGLLSGALGAAVALLVIVFVSIAGALEPALYVNGFVQLFPVNRRARIRSVLLEAGDTLRTWFAARLLTMCVTASLVTIGLTVLHVPLAISLGVIAGILAFIPNIGAYIAAAPAVALAFVQNPASAIAVVVMYIVVHVLDDFVVAPFVERQVVKLPPILTLVTQIVLGFATGALGVMLAAPLVAAGMVIVKRLWVEDVADPAPPALRL